VRMIFVNLPVADRDRAEAFYAALGFRLDEQFSDEKCASFVIEQNIAVMLLTRDRFADFVTGEVGDPSQATSVLNCLSAGSRDEVDEMVAKAIAAGGKPWQPGRDHGFMVIAPDARRPGAYLQHYFDSRGVVRLYEMTLDGDLWTLSRTTADFSPLELAQRFTGRFSADGGTITGRWENSPDGADWRLDFRLTYRRGD
jgi:predicted lactoylglutathione lyase